jgi:hypothetical protein
MHDYLSHSTDPVKPANHQERINRLTPQVMLELCLWQTRAVDCIDDWRYATAITTWGRSYYSSFFVVILSHVCHPYLYRTGCWQCDDPTVLA